MGDAAASWPALATLVATQVLATASAIVAAFVAIRFDARRSANDALIRRRIALYDEIVPRLNDLLCFSLCIGGWRAFTPPAMVAHKRDLDRTLHVWGPLFPPSVIARYRDFILLCFATHTGAGHDARLRADRGLLRAQWGQAWNAAWDDCLAGGTAPDGAEFRRAYEAFVAELAHAIGSGVRRGSAGIPQNE